jgi:hypothetical protein
MTERIVRIFTRDSHGDQHTLAFDIEKFVSLDIDTCELTLTNGTHYVQPKSMDDLIRAYRDYYRYDIKGKFYPDTNATITGVNADMPLECGINDVKP